MRTQGPSEKWHMHLFEVWLRLAAATATAIGRIRQLLTSRMTFEFLVVLLRELQEVSVAYQLL